MEKKLILVTLIGILKKLLTNAHSVEGGKGMEKKICLSCGHYAFGCFVTGDYRNIEADDTCEKWCPEGTKGTVTEYEVDESDGTTWKENEYLQDDLSNL